MSDAAALADVDGADLGGCRFGIELRADGVMTFYILVRGPLGIGKSTVAERLARQIEGEHISIDRILDERGLERWYRGYYSQRSFLRANVFAAEQARECLGRGTPVVFDGNFYYKSQIDDLVGQLDYPHHVFTLTAPLSVCIERDSRRSPSFGSEAARAVYKKSTEFDYGVEVDATCPVRSVIHQITSNLPRRPGSKGRGRGP
ncbi:MAG: ATP-binding protein [Thermoplasmata archaeon]